MTFSALVCLTGCDQATNQDANATFLRQQVRANLSFGIGMADLLYTGSPQWCTMGTTDLGAYHDEGDFEADPQMFSRGYSMQLPLSDAERVAAFKYLAFTVLKARYVRSFTYVYVYRCYEFDQAAIKTLGATYRHGGTARFSSWGDDPRMSRIHGSVNWELVVPAGQVSVDSVEFVNEYKVALGMETTCRAYRVTASYKGVIQPLNGRQFIALSSFCLDPRDNIWHQAEFKWA